MNGFKLVSTLAMLVSVSVLAVAQSPDGEDRRPLFGETHIHTAYSFDAYLFSTRATPDDAYEFAKGRPLKHPLGKTHQLKRPLDFMAVTDHAFFMGSMMKMSDESHRLSKHPLAKIVNDPDPDVRVSGFGAVLRGNIDGKPINLVAWVDPAALHSARFANAHFSSSSPVSARGQHCKSALRVLRNS